MHYAYTTRGKRNALTFAAVVHLVHDNGATSPASYKAGFPTRSKAHNYAKAMAKTLAERNGTTYTNAINSK